VLHLEGQPLPYPDRGHLHHILGRLSSFDAGRGCPFSCSFCTIINVQPRMTAVEWQSIYDEAWRLYYSPDHIETLLKRAIVSGVKPARVATMIFSFYAGHTYEGVHPLQAELRISSPTMTSCGTRRCDNLRRSYSRFSRRHT
jgi:hypothetical protein